MVPKQPRELIQKADRLACSCLVHHIPVIATKPGEIVASKIPKKKRTVAKPANESHAAVIIRMLAHAIMLTIISIKLQLKSKKESNLPPKNLARGNFWSKVTPGNSAIKYPK